MLDPKLAHPGQRLVRERENPHTYPCPHCGQLVDKRDLAAVFHHEVRPHQPLTEIEATRIEAADRQLHRTMERK
jgi:hypothetical protein